MYRFKRTKRSVSCLIILSMMLSGVLTSCSQTQETSAVSETTAATTDTTEETTTEESETEEDDVYQDDHDDDYSDGLPSWFESTNGELEGMDEYMSLRTEHWTDQVITDTDVIEDEQVREAAQGYSDQGYTLFDCGGVSSFGDLEYGFRNGFSGQGLDNGVLKNISVWKMNETLFNHFILETNVYWNPDEGAYEDDGVFMRRYLEKDYIDEFGDPHHYYCCYEFNRETGLFTFYEEDDNPGNWVIHIVPDFEYDDPELEEIAQNCIDAGCSIRRIGSPDVTALDYDISLGFEAQSEDLSVYVYYMDEDTFNEYFYEGQIEEWYSDEYEVEDDGTVIRYLMGDSNTAYEYDRDSGRAIYIMDWSASGSTSEGLSDTLDTINGI